MKKNNKHPMQYAGLGILFLATSQAVMADDTSPLSPKFVLQPNQILSTTNVAYQKVDFEIYSDISGFGSLHANSEITDKLIGQSLRLGLPDNYEIGISETYSSGKSSRPQVAHILDGFSNPTIFAKKTWGANSNTLFNVNLSATPKTGDIELRATPTIYNLGIATALTTPNGLVTTIGLNRLLINSNGPKDSTTIQIGAYKELASYTLSASGSLQLFDDQSPTATSASLDSILSLSTSLGRQVTTNSWVLLTYKHASATYQTRTGSINDTFGASYSLNELGASLRVLF